MAVGVQAAPSARGERLLRLEVVSEFGQTEDGARRFSRLIG